ncbi:MAG: SDR family oxidoreductase [Polyangiaceae bacterium]|jgi:short-subunit dehydrogenase
MNKANVVVITGASAGVGRAAVRRFAAGGADVALVARGAAGLEAARAEVEALGRRALVLPLDVADAKAVEDAAARVEDTLGPIDVWVNDAMTTCFGEFLAIEPDEFKRATEVSYLGYVYGTRAALERMLPRDRGTVVQVGSALAYRSIPLQSAYCGAKHAIRGFTDSLRCELRHHSSNVWLTMVQMPALNTPQFGWCENKMSRASQPVPPIYQPEVAAEAIWYAAHHRRREINVGAPTAVIVPGNKLLPGVGDWYLGRTGYASQQRDAPPSSPGGGNLWQPRDAERDHGARGRFDRRAHGRSPELWASTHKGAVALLAAGASALGALALVGSRLR